MKDYPKIVWYLMVSNWSVRCSKTQRNEEFEFQIQRILDVCIVCTSNLTNQHKYTIIFKPVRRHDIRSVRPFGFIAMLSLWTENKRTCKCVHTTNAHTVTIGEQTHFELASVSFARRCLAVKKKGTKSKRPPCVAHVQTDYTQSKCETKRVRQIERYFVHYRIHAHERNG